MTIVRKFCALLACAAMLQGCARLERLSLNLPGTMLDFPRNRAARDEPPRPIPARNQENPSETVRLAPERFNVTGRAVWDGRPSFGGIWVASPDAIDPERVVVTNLSNGRQVLGALFKREAFMDGPPIQLSSEAASALGIQAGTTASLSIVAVARPQED